MKNSPTDSTIRRQIEILQEEMNSSVIGQQRVVERLLVGLLAGGNVLIEGLPGLAKTRAITSMARVLEAGLARIQFTPDLLPSDITGSEVYYSSGGNSEFRFEPGPVFNNLILADEINRAPAKVQSALLEAMEERQVTVAGTTHRMPDLFMVLATQNPIEQEGTYPLPEAQMDRFLMHVFISYPTPEAELEMLRLVRGERSGSGADKSRNTISQETIFAARQEIEAIYISENVERYIVDLVGATRNPGELSTELAPLAELIEVGASPRGSISLERCGRVLAWLRGREHVSPEDIRDVAHDVLRHRIILSYTASSKNMDNDQLISRILELVPVT